MQRNALSCPRGSLLDVVLHGCLDCILGEPNFCQGWLNFCFFLRRKLVILRLLFIFSHGSFFCVLLRSCIRLCLVLCCDILLICSQRLTFLCSFISVAIKIFSSLEWFADGNNTEKNADTGDAEKNFSMNSEDVRNIQSCSQCLPWSLRRYL